MELVVAAALAVLFYMMAAYEHHAAWVWALASLTLSTLVLGVGGGSVTLVLGHVGLYGLLWWFNAREQDKRHEGFLAKRAEQQRLRADRWRRAQQEIEADRNSNAGDQHAPASERPPE